MTGQSTFMVELQETSNILRNSSKFSLVVLDELGRGTSTFDGYSIAFATLKQLAKLGCLVLFSTHYHLLTDDFADDNLVSLYHMACEVDQERKQIIYLYTLTKGVCPKSYGMNVATAVGLPQEVVERAVQIAQQFEANTALQGTNFAVNKMRALRNTFMAIYSSILKGDHSALLKLHSRKKALE